MLSSTSLAVLCLLAGGSQHLVAAQNQLPTTASSTAAATGSSTTTSASSSTTTTGGAASSSASATSSGNPFAVIPSGYTSPQAPAPINYTFASGYNPSSKWEAAHQKARSYLADWTIEQKVHLTTGTGWQIGRCVGNIPSIPEKGFPGLCLEDSPLGVRFADYASAFPAGINVASTFDKGLMYERGYAMGQEFKGKGVNVALGPMTNMGRVAAGGRNWEGFGADPYLSGWASYETIKGMQDAGVQATVKHYVGNEQERNRTTSSSNIDDRTIREIYTHPFLRAVQADVASVMCSYNLINGSWACQNSKTLNGILKDDFGFQGYVMSDWSATHSGVLAANSGLDMDMPGDVSFGSLTSFFGQNLTQSVVNGSVPLARLDDMAQRIVAAWYLLGQDQNYPAVNFDAFRPNAPENNSHVNVQADHYKLIKHIGESSTVLLKNKNNTLPLKKPRNIALIGSDLGPSVRGPNGYPDRGGDEGTLAMGWGSGTANFPYLIDPLTAIAHQARQDQTTLQWWFNDWDLSGISAIAQVADVTIVGINSDSGEEYIVVDGNVGDRNNLTAWHNGDNVVLAAANHSSNVVVVVHSVGPIIMEKWIDHPNVTAVLWAGLPGQESGNALVDVLYGRYNPSGRLPYTIAKERNDYPAEIIYVNTSIPAEPQVNYTEGLFIDYRHFLQQNITPRYEFGFGLSYSRFNYTNLQVWNIDDGSQCGGDGHGGQKRNLYARQTSMNGTVGANGTVPLLNVTMSSSMGMATATGGGPGPVSVQPNATTTASSTASAAPTANATMPSGGSSGNNTAGTPANGTLDGVGAVVGRFLVEELQRPRWTVTADIQNVGGVYGCDIPQMYLSYPEGSGEPPKVLRDFTRITLDPWQAEKVYFNLSNYDVSYWDVVSQDWKIPSGQFTVHVAKSSMGDGVVGTFCPDSSC